MVLVQHFWDAILTKRCFKRQVTSSIIKPPVAVERTVQQPVQLEVFQAIDFLRGLGERFLALGFSTSGRLKRRDRFSPGPCE